MPQRSHMVCANVAGHYRHLITALPVTGLINSPFGLVWPPDLIRLFAGLVPSGAALDALAGAHVILCRFAPIGSRVELATTG